MPALSTPPAPSATVGGPGPTGPAGQSAYTFTTAPVSGYNGTANLVVSVQNTSFLGLTSPVFIPNVGGFEVNAISGTQLTLLPLNIIGTAPFTIPSGTMVASAGYPGLNGATGNTGPQGIAGPQGPVGPQGLQGPAGQAGATGPTGPQGATGQQGTQGPPGTTGATGATGPQGPIGVKGDPGPQGTQGIQGVSGPQGPTGPIGATGPIGPQGNPGPAVSAQGAWTPSGVYAQGDLVTWNNLIYIGLAASQNAQPDQHPTLWAVYSSIGIQGPQGATGPAGPPGAAGPQGVAGPQGSIGADGATGATGPAGSPGPTGNTGPQGAQGPTGATGPMGPTGPQGVAGPSVVWRGNWTAASTYNPNDGVSYQGNSYVAISTNSNAPPPSTAWQLIAQQGGVGPQGPIGNTGPAGPIGPTGATGSQGPTGPAGATGPPGPTAVSGNAGNTAMLGTDNLLFVPATPLATTTKQGSIVQLSGNATQVLLGTNAFGAVPLSTTGNQGGIIAITNSATDVLLGTNAFGAVPAATASKAGGIPALSGNTTDFLDGTNHFQPLAPAIWKGFVSKTAAYTLTTADSGKYIICSGGSWTLTLPAAAPGLIFQVRNDQGITGTTGLITLTPTGGATIDGLATQSLCAGQECTLITDGTNWRTLGRVREVILGTQDISSATASAFILLPPGYRYYELIFEGVQCDTTGNLNANFSLDGGATWKTDATYVYMQLYTGTTTTAAALWNTTGTSAQLTAGILAAGIANGRSRCRIHPGGISGQAITWTVESSWAYGANSWNDIRTIGGYYQSGGVATNALRYQMNNGNITRSFLTVKGVV